MSETLSDVQIRQYAEEDEEGEEDGGADFGGDTCAHLACLKNRILDVCDVIGTCLRSIGAVIEWGRHLSHTRTLSLSRALPLSLSLSFSLSLCKTYSCTRTLHMHT